MLGLGCTIVRGVAGLSPPPVPSSGSLLILAVLKPKRAGFTGVRCSWLPPHAQFWWGHTRLRDPLSPFTLWNLRMGDCLPWPFVFEGDVFMDLGQYYRNLRHSSGILCPVKFIPNFIGFNPSCETSLYVIQFYICVCVPCIYGIVALGKTSVSLSICSLICK